MTRTDVQQRTFNKEQLAERLFDLFAEGSAGRNLQIGSAFCVGSLKGPRDQNQDRACVAYIHRGGKQQESIVVGLIGDGMGGMEAGDLASALALSTFLSELAVSEGSIGKRLEASMHQANRRIFERIKGNGGTTLTALTLSSNNDQWIAHAGDSRAYSISDDGSISILTRDDTISGLIDKATPVNISDENSPLVQFVGIGTDFSPHIQNVTAHKAKTFLLLTDGIYRLGTEILNRVAKNAHSATDLARKLLFITDAVPSGDNGSAVALARELPLGKTYHDGITLALWTPERQLELWISPISPHAENPSPGGGKPKRRRNAPDGGKSVKSRAPRSATDEKLKQDQRDTAAPLLEVVIGDTEKKND